MKKIYLTLIIIFSAFQLTFAQWSTVSSNTTTLNNVGIGLTLPLAPFHISSAQYIPAITGNTQNSGFRLGASPATNLVLDAGVNAATNVYTWLQSRNQSDYSANYTLALNPNGGNVGIGTTTPQAILSTAGGASGANTTGLFLQNSGGTVANTAVSLDFAVTTSLTGPVAIGRISSIRTNRAVSGDADIAFSTFSNSVLGERMRITDNGSLCIGTANPNGYKLAVNGSVVATAVTVKAYTSWPDYVFTPSYQLPSLTDIKTYIDQNQHLPEMPSAADVEKNGLNLGEVNTLLTKKVEELTLYLIEKDKEIKEQKALNQSFQEQLSQLAEQLKALKTAAVTNHQ